jgi:hypothetical protein
MTHRRCADTCEEQCNTWELWLGGGAMQSSQQPMHKQQTGCTQLHVCRIQLQVCFMQLQVHCTHKHVHVLVQAIPQDQVVGHGQPVWLHGVVLSKIERRELAWKQVGQRHECQGVSKARNKPAGVTCSMWCTAARSTGLHRSELMKRGRASNTHCHRSMPPCSSWGLTWFSEATGALLLKCC